MIIFRRLHVSPALIKLIVLVGLVWASLVGPYSSILILKSIGAESSQIGVFSAINAVISMVAQPMWGLVSDKIGSPRRVLLSCLLVSTMIFGSVMLTDSFYIAAVLLCIDNFFRCCTITLLDSHTMSELNAIPGVRYGYVRMFGSIFYGVVSVTFSRIISDSGAGAVIPYALVIASIAVVYGLFFAKGKWELQEKDDSRSIDDPSPKESRDLKKDIGTLLSNKLFLTYIIFTAVLSMGANPCFTYMIDFLTSVGGKAGDVPLIHAMRCVIEVPLLITTGLFSARISPRKLMLAGVVFYLMQMCGLMLADSNTVMKMVYVFGTPSFVLCLAGKVQYIKEISPASVRSTAYTVAGACEIGLGSIVGNFVGGFISQAYGPRILAIVEFAAISTALCILLYIIRSAPLNVQYQQRLQEQED